jgi:hypothetical protein
VWVTPSVGGPHTIFIRHFPELLNEASYYYRLSGPRCPTISFLGGDVGGDSTCHNSIATRLRGLISNQLVANPSGTWRSGTYHLSAGVMDLGPFGGYTHPWKPFGTTTFTDMQRSRACPRRERTERGRPTGCRQPDLRQEQRLCTAAILHASREPCNREFRGPAALS